MAAKEMGQLSLIDALSVACYARTEVQSLRRRLSGGSCGSQRNATHRCETFDWLLKCLEALRTSHHDLAKKMLLRLLT
jgi:hypothetical protein